MIKKMTVTRDELRPGDFPIAAEPGQQYITIYREIPEFGTSAELNAAQEELARVKKTLSGVNEVAHRYFAQARRLDSVGASAMARRARVHAERILAALRGEPLQDWVQPNPDETHRDLVASAEYWSQWLTTVTEETLSDGTPLLTAVFQQNPQLADRLKKALEKK